MLLIIAFLHTKQPFNSAWASKEEIIGASEDRLSNVLCGEQACHASDLSVRKFRAFAMCVWGGCLFSCGVFSVFQYFRKSGGMFLTESGEAYEYEDMWWWILQDSAIWLPGEHVSG